MATQLELQAKLEGVLGSRNVYYQPPETVKMAYPAIVYSRPNIGSRFANDAAYSHFFRYELIVIDRKPDNPVIMELLKFRYCSYDRQYISNNLYHDVLTLYF